MESIVTRKYNVSPREIASYENSFEEFDRGKLPVARGRLAANLEENSTVQIGVHAQRKGGGLKGERRG